MTHEPHFCLLREVVSFSGASRGRPTREVLENPCQESFILLQIGLLREYLELEFRNDALPFPFSVERVIDDFVLFCMLIGNDFLPGTPHKLLQLLCYLCCYLQIAVRSLFGPSILLMTSAPEFAIDGTTTTVDELMKAYPPIFELYNICCCK